MATAIITSDIHLREDQPVCRADDFWTAQEEKIRWLCGLAKKYDCPILDAGDLFNHWKPSPRLLQWALRELPPNIFTIPGNHDLPAHSLTRYGESGLGVLEEANKVLVLKSPNPFQVTGNPSFDLHPFPWGMEPAPCPPRRRTAQRMNRRVALIHTMTYHGESPWPGCVDPNAEELMEQMAGYDLIIVGHNHKPFVLECEGRVLLSPGCLTRQSADQAAHKPRVWLWFAEDNRVEPLYAPAREGVVVRDHIDSVEERDARIDAFVQRLSGDWEVGLSFERNLEGFFSTNRVRKGVKDIVWEAVG